ncbi:hypothetical protein B0G62_12660 [Paraburkholderia eburnea]|uniref:Uncharacterized protein n=1 Tax=Paraburkholderia eburnea TaxID=1189126 RepID=A0A2S4LUS8_9BURK|nr:hypothetical protein [Paraburkholderia eburnea]POR46211.1 hypothetical protein B0G62_12660 [Paraburkholderia eburnea]PRZ25930.1 hypothetical protein BX588_102547 [Paraburkholderia eburnea]
MKQMVTLGAILAATAVTPSFGQSVNGTPYPARQSARCAAVNEEAAKNSVPYELAQSDYAVAGTGRLQFFYAPAVGCEMKGVFVVPRDKLVPAEEYVEFTDVTYVNPKTGEKVEGWVETRRLAKNGNRAYLNEESTAISGH